jgi:hypothetical protein
MKSFPLFVLALLELVFGIVAGCVAIAAIITEMLARAASAGATKLGGALGVDPVAPRLRQELAQLLLVGAAPAGGAR